MLSLFITGTDTDVGKTVITGGLLKAFATRGFQTIGYKPISAGCHLVEDTLVNDDARFIQHCSSITADLKEINPIRYAKPIAPHIAAAERGEVIRAEEITHGWQHLITYEPDVILTEGAGGWELPINNEQTLPDVIASLCDSVILVVGMRLGCLNHALLTAQAIQQRGIIIAGWVANKVDDHMPFYAENIQTLKQRLHAPLLGEVPHLSDENSPFEHPIGAEQFLTIEPLIER